VVHQLLWLAVFSAAFAFVESSVVVYLRALYYPGGFAFPLRLMAPEHIAVELAREAATLVMLAGAGVLAGRTAWERFAHFLVAFGVWDIMFYVWLKIVLGWPATLFDWDILFLLPLPWIGPVIAPVCISALMTSIGVAIILRLQANRVFRPGRDSWMLALAGSAVLLWSFMRDTEAGLRGGIPAPYAYEMLVIGLILYVVGFVAACRPRTQSTKGAITT
jgi:hypothetical protein